MLINREPFKVNIPPRSKARLNRTRDVDRTLEAHPFHPVLDYLEVHGDHARHLDGTAERNLTITLREVQITNTELGTVHMNGEVHLGSSAQILDIAVASMLGATGHRSRSFLGHLLRDLLAGRAGMGVDGLWQVGDVAIGEGTGSHQLSLALVPRRQHLGRRSATDDAWVDQTGELDARDVARGGVDAFKVPDGFGG